MDRNCGNCKKNKFQSVNSCGYLSKEEREGGDTWFGATKDKDMYVSVCPVWYYNEYIGIYRTFNLMRASSLNLLEENFTDRYIFEVATIYLSQKKEESSRLKKR